MSKSKEKIEQYRCQQCNGPYPLGADDVIATCPYCGFTFEVGGGEIKKHLLVPTQLSSDEVKDTVLEWLKFATQKTIGTGVMKDIELEEPRLSWIPMFRVEGICDAYFMGAEEISRGNTEFWKKKEGRLDEVGVEFVLARRYSSTFGIKELIESLDGVKTIAFDLTSTESAPVLNAEIDSNDSKPRAKTKRAERDRERLESELSVLYDYRLNMDVRFADYVHVSYWLVRYSYQNGTYRIALSGGTGKVILGELPITKLYRVKKWITSVSMLVISALLLQFLPYVTAFVLAVSDNDSSGDLIAIPVFVGLTGILLWFGSYRIMGAVLNYEVCLNADAEERRKRFTLTGAIDDLVGRFK